MHSSCCPFLCRRALQDHSLSLPFPHVPSSLSSARNIPPPLPLYNSHFLPQYLEKKVIKVDPFVTIDEEGVGQLVKMTTEKMKVVKQGQAFTAGICGEHGGDPASVAFFSRAGLDYVSCSPYRVPIAWIAAAQASIKDGTSKGTVNGNGKAY